MEEEKFCHKCGALLDSKLINCKNCGAIYVHRKPEKDVSKFKAISAYSSQINNVNQSVRKPNKSRKIAILLAFTLGIIGMHKFYLGHTRSGIVYLLLSLTLVSVLFSIVDGIALIMLSEEKFNNNYGYKGIDDIF